MKLEQIKLIIQANREADRGKFDGLTSSEIGTYSQWLMFGDDNEAFPSSEEWAMITD